MRRVALIPGGARGIGRAVAQALAARGWDVALCYRRSEADAKIAVAAVEAAGGSALALCADVSAADACGELYDQVLAWRGQIDALIHCAGPFRRVDVLAETPEGWRSMFANNLDSLFYLARLVAPGMIERRWGRIVGFAMANADRTTAHTQLTAHYLAKVGVLGLVRSLAKALAPHRITANSISPGFIDSGSIDLAELAQMAKSIPAGNVGTVDDVVSAVLYLLSDEAGYVNGTNINVSGGWGI
ncbi:MAG: SDR family oxidoreductase [Deltaproteobacteria bacterium]|jgi:3-oxoacyl-[acyl-carrier protein] reductase|nr:SDR family oxidoreductase [Deltaproteobacteria bacterium]